MKIPGKAIASGLAVLALLFVVLLYYRGQDCLSEPPDKCLRLNTAAWTAIGAAATVFYAILTLFLVVFAALQIRSARKDAKINRTLIACDRYDTDLLLDRAERRLSIAFENKSLEEEPRKFRFDLESLLNYFETIAIGVKSGLYDEDIVRDQLKRIFLKKVDEYLLKGIAALANVADGNPEAEYTETLELYYKWLREPPAPENN